MFKYLSEKLVNTAVHRNIIPDNEIEECVYGINAFFTVALNLLTVFAIGAAAHMLIEITIYIIIFKSLRKYVGGIHATTPLRCYIYSCFTYLAVLTAIKFYPLPELGTFCLALSAAAVMLLLAPVDAIKKPLDDKERLVFGRRAYIRILISLILFLTLYFIKAFPDAYYYSVVVMVSMLIVAVFTVIGKIKLIHFQKKGASI